jgi:hypothetical protein
MAGAILIVLVFVLDRSATPKFEDEDDNQKSKKAEAFTFSRGARLFCLVLDVSFGQY